MNILDGLKRWEGFECHLYLDSKGLPTTGIGHLVATLAACLDLPWYDPDGGLTAEENVEASYRSVITAPHGHGAGFYAQFSVMRLMPDDVERIAQQRLDTEFLPALRDLFRGFDGYPPTAQEALIDMVYNLGSHGLAKFSHLSAACEAGDWDRAARSCHIASDRDDRNEYHVQLFGAAARSEAVTPGAVPTDLA